MTIYGVAMFHPCLPLPYQIASRATEASTEVTPLLVHEIEGVQVEGGGRREEGGRRREGGRREEGGRRREGGRREEGGRRRAGGSNACLGRALYSIPCLFEGQCKIMICMV